MKVGRNYKKAFPLLHLPKRNNKPLFGLNLTNKVINSVPG